MTALIDFFDNMPVTLEVLPSHKIIITRKGAQHLGFDTAWDLLGFLQSQRLCIPEPDGEPGTHRLNVTLAAQGVFMTEGGFLLRTPTGDLCLTQETWVTE